MPDEYRRPTDDAYWVPAWSSIAFSGDVFEAIPFGAIPIEIVEADDEGPTQHFVGLVEYGFGLLVSPTCDIYESLNPPRIAHGFRTLVPIIDLQALIGANPQLADEGRLGNLTARDMMFPYMYLPPLPGYLDGPSVACLFRSVTLSDGMLERRRVAQMSPQARRHLKYKLAMYWGRVRVAIDKFAERERDERLAASEADPPSSYDATTRYEG